jgi:hypothetical protein
LSTKELAVATRQRAVSHHGTFDRKNFTPSDFSLFPKLKTKTRCRHFDRIDVIEAESQTVPNTTSRMHLKQGRSSGNGAYMQEGEFSRVIMDNRPKTIFDQMAAPVPEIMDSSGMSADKCGCDLDTFIIVL